jgi:cation:H+ antiporter
MGYVFFLIIGFVLLIKSADWLVVGATALAKKLGVSDLVIGLTVVAFGTSMPELFVNIFSSIQGNTEIAMGNVVGSNIFNILLILGVASLIRPLVVTKGTVWKEIPFSLLAALVLGVLANDVFFDRSSPSVLSRIDGLVFISFFAMFMYYIFSISRGRESRSPDKESKTGIFRLSALVACGLCGLAFGGKLVVDGAVAIAVRLGVSQSLIGLTIVAAGTSLPELATSAVAAYKKNSDIAVGNIVGSNIFNIFWVLGVSCLIRPLPISAQTNADLLMLIGTSLFLFFSMFIGKRRTIDRWEGAVFLSSKAFTSGSCY